MLKTMKVFGCSPYKGDVIGNTERARRYARHVAVCGYCPVFPHLFFSQFLDDNDPEERIQGITLGVELMKVCDEVWIYGTHISKGMAYELEEARKLGIPVRMYDTKCNRIEPATLAIDERVDDAYRKAVYGMKFA